MNFKIESLLSARLFVSPQLAGDRLYFVSDLAGRLSLYAMDRNGSVPEPLLPQNIALQNPSLIEGYLFVVYPHLGKIMVLIDNNGDENYNPMFIPIDGGLPEPIFGNRFQGQQVRCSQADPEKNLAVFQVDTRNSPVNETYLVDLDKRELTDVGTSIYGNWCLGHNADWTRLVLGDGYLAGDTVMYLWEKGVPGRRLVYGTPIEERREGQEVPFTAFGESYITEDNRGIVCVTALFSDTYGLAYIPLDNPGDLREVRIAGAQHQGVGELSTHHLTGNRSLIEYNSDGVSWLYEGTFDRDAMQFNIERTLAGHSPLDGGDLQSIAYDQTTGRYALSFSSATSPTQLYTREGDALTQVTRERVLGIPQRLLSPGQDASFTSHDGLRVSARLYLPSPELGYEGKRPVVFYIHGGPQGQERPNFAWFSMPLIQFLTLNGFAVFVPNVRGSSGYGLKYMRRVDHDWGGQDRLDQVAAFDHLRQDPRLDMDRAGVMGRSYGGYMTLTLAGRHPELWKAAVDMFGPYNLITFIQRLPDTWQTYFYMAVGHPDKDKDFLIERSPSTYLHQLTCPMLVIQGHNDPRVVEAESRDLVEHLRAQGKQMDLLVFENEGHDVIKLPNKVRCYNEIVDFFRQYLRP
ncbi:MAG: prolyl oligopeptidase family serine peptidase [Anaerolineae bacterium]